MPQLTNQYDASLRDSLKLFLSFQSKLQPSTKYCTECGALCSYLPTEFWLEGDEEIFTIWLTFCAQCNPELLSRVPACA